MREALFRLYLPLVSTVLPPSGYFLANRLGRILLDSLNDAVGRNGLNALLNLSNLGVYVAAPPLDDLTPAFDIAVVSSLLGVLEMVYGPRGARGLAMRTGRGVFGRLLNGFGLPTGFNALSHFASAFRKCSDRRPSDYRQGWAPSEPAPSWPGTLTGYLETLQQRTARAVREARNAPIRTT